MILKKKMSQLQTQYEEKLARLKMTPFDNKINNNQNTNTDFDNQCQIHLEHLKQISNALDQSSLRSNSQSVLQTAFTQVNQLQRLHHLALDQQRKDFSQNYQTQFQNLQKSQTEQMETILQQAELRNQQQSIEIKKLKKDKREMINVVNKKIQDLQYLHCEELKKERIIAKALSDELKEQSEVFMKDIQRLKDERNNNVKPITLNEQQIILDKDKEINDLKMKLEQMQRQQKEILLQNEALMKSKRTLEQQVMVLSDRIVQTVSKIK